MPEPDCLAAMLEELDRTGAPGVRGSSVPEAHGGMGEFERDAFEEALRVEEDPDHWRKILIHSLAIRRDCIWTRAACSPCTATSLRGPLPSPCIRTARDSSSAPARASAMSTTVTWTSSGPTRRSFGRGEMRFRERGPGPGRRQLPGPRCGVGAAPRAHSRGGAARPARRDRPAPAGHAARRIASCRGCCVRPAAGGGSRAAGCLARGAAGSPLTGCRRCAPGIPGVLAIDEPAGPARRARRD